MTRNPQPRKYVDNAAKQAAYRERYAVFQVRIKRETAETLERICESRDIPRTDLVADLIAFALANRNWHDSTAYARSIVSAPQARRVPTKYQGDDNED
jgi:hypothetical protein